MHQSPQIPQPCPVAAKFRAIAQESLGPGAKIRLRDDGTTELAIECESVADARVEISRERLHYWFPLALHWGCCWVSIAILNPSYRQIEAWQLCQPDYFEGEDQQ